MPTTTTGLKYFTKKFHRGGYYQQINHHDNTIQNRKTMSSEDKAREYLQAYLTRDMYGLFEDERRDCDCQHLLHMLNKYPALASQKFDGYFPLTFMVQDKSPLEMIQKVYQMYPDAVTVCDDEGSWPLHDAIICHCSFEVIAFLSDKGPDVLSRGDQHSSLPFHLLCEGTEAYPDRFRTEEYTKLFMLFFEGLEDTNDHSASDLPGEILGSLLDCPRTEPALLKWIAGKYSGGASANFNLPHYDGQNSDLIIHRLKQFVPLLEECCDLSFDDYPDWSLYARMFSEVNIPSHLMISIRGVEVTFPADFDAIVKGWKSCNIESLTLDNVSISGENFGRLLRSLAVLPNLEALYLEANSEGNIIECTDALIEFLESSSNLDILHFGECGKLVVDVEKLCVALQTSKSRALVEYEKSGEEKPSLEIAYHSCINRHGRTKITASNATKELLVKCLCSAKDAQKLEESLWYGLLRAAPHLWATSSSGRTKKRRATRVELAHKRKKIT